MARSNLVSAPGNFSTEIEFSGPVGQNGAELSKTTPIWCRNPENAHRAFWGVFFENGQKWPKIDPYIVDV